MKDLELHIKKASFSYLVISVLVFLQACESCLKTMAVSGRVVDANTMQPLSSVSVFCCFQFEDSTAVATTDSDGRYSFTKNNLGGFSGGSVRFEKTGYVTQTAAQISEAEAGIDRCGQTSVTRDLSLSP